MDQYGCSSPYLPWENLEVEGTTEPSEKGDFSLQLDDELLSHINSKDVLACPDLVAYLSDTSDDEVGLAFSHQDPSTYLPNCSTSVA